MKNKSKLMKKFKYGTIATVTVAIVLAIVVLLNVIMTMITEKYPVKFDLTQDKRYELSQESIDFLSNLDSEVEIAVTLTEEENSTAVDMSLLILTDRFRQKLFRSSLKNTRCMLTI